jgi:hypothetical protein
VLCCSADREATRQARTDRQTHRQGGKAKRNETKRNETSWPGSDGLEIHFLLRNENPLTTDAWPILPFINHAAPERASSSLAPPRVSPPPCRHRPRAIAPSRSRVLPAILQLSLIQVSNPYLLFLSSPSPSPLDNKVLDHHFCTQLLSRFPISIHPSRRSIPFHA